MFLRPVFDPQLAQYAYLVGCPDAGEALLVDPQRDVDRYVALAQADDLAITAVAETHVHADFLSGARELAERHDATVYRSAEGGPDRRCEWAENYDVRLLDDGDSFSVGEVELEALHTPGHTPEHLSFLVTDGRGDGAPPMGLLSGDCVFVGDTGRPDLLETAAGERGAAADGARALFESVQRVLDLDDYLQVWPGHGAGSACGKALGDVPATTVGYERRISPALKAARDGEAAFTDYILEDQPEPPLYFARMKTLNRDGPPLLGERPAPPALSAGDLSDLDATAGATVLDLRPDRAAAMRSHLPGAIYIPSLRRLPTIAGSYVAPEQPIYLVLAEERVEEAVRSLVRVGLDRVAGYATPQTLAAYAEEGGALASVPVIDMDEMDARRRDDGTQVIDVRSRSEHRSGHVPGALLAPHPRLPEQTERLPTDRTLLVHCGGGVRASSAASLLARRGFDVVHVNDRFSNWSDAHPDELRKAA
ncbi:MAG: MBL fold metallo-hydrolase [Bacteroidetes bacterium QS_8_68_15]|nr:MAG: MBL fold metallo-hydrolase [Bacteroidetes bacterium QS_8_68_15]